MSPASAPDQDLLVITRERTSFYDVAQQLSATGRVEIRLDRRQGERRRAPQSPDSDERRRAYRRACGLNAAGRAAGAATFDLYKSRYGAAIPTRGGAAALTVPGAPSGWWEAHRYSRETMRSPIAWSGLFEHAIAHARDGIAVSAG